MSSGSNDQDLKIYRQHTLIYSIIIKSSVFPKSFGITCKIRLGPINCMHGRICVAKRSFRTRLSNLNIIVMAL